MKKVTIEIEAADEYIDGIVAMLKFMETCGNAGHSTSFEVYVDGDGAFQIVDSNLDKLIEHPDMTGADEVLTDMFEYDDADEPIKLGFE